jgi:hypothetical protein
MADQRVERSLYERAVGYSYHSEKLFCHEGDVIRVPITEHVPPDVKVAMHWLHNRKPKECKEHDFEVKGEDGNVFRVQIMA